MRFRLTQHIVLLVLTGCHDEGREAPKEAGKPFHDCAKYGPSPTSLDATFHRGSLRMSLRDRSADRDLATLRAEWTFAVTDGFPSPLIGCIDVTDVNKQVAVQPSLHVLPFGSEQQSAVVLVDVGANVFAPARVRDGTRLNHPEAWFSWRVSAKATGVDYSIHEPTHRELQPAWDNVELVDELQHLGVEQIERPTQ